MSAVRPNILVILADDMGFSDIGCYGGEIDTPNLDSLADAGLRFTQFYNTARCSPSRASLLTGLHPHQVGVGILTGYDGPEGYEGHLNRNGVTIAEVLASAGYRTYMSGKWHLTSDTELYDSESDTWPIKRGFDRHFGTIAGGGNYWSPRTIVRDGENIDAEVRQDADFYYTDAVSDNAVRFLEDHFDQTPDKPFFQYVAYTAPHWPLHAKAEDIAKYKGRFAAGWDELRRQRLDRLVEMGIIDPAWKLSPRDPGVPAWDEAENKEWQQRRMETYAAQVDCMDQGIGRIVDVLRRRGQLDNTLLIFLSDNGGCPEEIDGWLAGIIPDGPLGVGLTTPDGREVRYGNDPDVLCGDESTYQSYGVPWSNLSNAPFRMYKHWAHEGGIATPFIVHWPNGLDARGELRHQPAQLTDIMPTVLEAAGAEYPAEYKGRPIKPVEGTSLSDAFIGQPHDTTLFFEHEGNAAVRRGKWKLVRDFTAAGTGGEWMGDLPTRGEWELYDIEADRTELHDLAADRPDIVAELTEAWQQWADRCDVIDREAYLRIARSWHEKQD